MKDQFIPYDQAKMMKELGFDEECLGVYVKPAAGGGERFYLELPSDHEGDLKASLYQQAEEWLWEQHKIQIRVSEDHTGKVFRSAAYWKNNIETNISDAFHTPTLAKNEGILAAINYIHQNKK